MDEIENDFAKVAEEINLKLKEAAKALHEANKLADDAGVPSLFFSQFTRDDMRDSNRYADPPLSKEDLNDKMDELEYKLKLINVKEFEREMNQAGWNSSSSYC
jgi:chaperonin cofactor prefoldin